MTSTDPIADMFSRIRNAAAVNKSVVSLPHSNAKQRVAQILVDNGFLKSLSVKENGFRKTMEITINLEGSNSTITELSRLSTPGRRLYVKTDKIPTVKRGRGIVIISTSRGVMSGEDAKSKHLGGELICQVY